MVKLENVVPWGRCFDEYIKMFNLTSDELNLNILDCAGGPASFNVEMTDKGYKVTSCDPIYKFTVAEIQQQIQQTYTKIINGVKATLDNFVWRDIASADELGKIRMAAMNQFLTDFTPGLTQKRYLPYELPTLPFPAKQFDLALCSHLLFTYTDQLSADFHLASILEMLRVAREVRVFPIVTQFSGDRSSHIEPIITELTARGFLVELKQVDYEFQTGGNQMLWVRSS